MKRNQIDAGAVKRRRLCEGGGTDNLDSDSNDDDAGGDLAADGNWEEFDAMPAQSVDVRGPRLN